jgi:hypothetical protein
MNGFGLRVLLALVAVVTLAGCSPNKIYRGTYQVCSVSATDNCERAAISLHKGGNNGEFSLGFVEYDDQGQLRDRKQMQFVVDHYREIAAKEDVIITVFVHGWHHSAAPGDNNIESFKKMLATLSNRENKAMAQDKNCADQIGSQGCQQKVRSKRRILGIYLGWRGDSITVPVLNQATFWDRKSVAQEVGLQGVTEVLLKLEEIINIKAGFEPQNPKPLYDRMVVMGHSFGGAVVYTALQQILADRYLNSERGKTVQQDAKGFGDLVILLNPAFEAMRYSTLYDIGQNCSYKFNNSAQVVDIDKLPASCRKYNLPPQLPRLAILTSEADYATRYAFPAGRIFSTLFETHDDIVRLIDTRDGSTPVTISESKADKTTVGHFEPYWTHTLDPIDSATKRGANFIYRSLGNDWTNQNYSSKLKFEDVELTHLNRSNPLNPYLNIYVSGELIKNHNDIWDERIQNFLQDLITISTTPVLTE